jgi:hypothetical protein
VFLFPHSCFMPRPSHPPRFEHFNYTWRRAQVWEYCFRSIIARPPPALQFQAFDMCLWGSRFESRLRRRIIRRRFFIILFRTSRQIPEQCL